ncbi:MAG: hypothetical protein P4L33_22575 [Capsulimonadaceae bacterium]|nr:hypothetical protein [Capsulimonadaceae bacterium]
MDLRLPVGALFAIFGALLTLFGAFGPKDIYEKSLGINVNLYWGAVLLVFGLLMAGFALAASKREAQAKAE